MKVLLYAVFKDPRSATHEDLDRDLRYRRTGTECESSFEDVPSKLSSTADSINRVGLDLYRDVVLFRELCAQTNLEKIRAKNLSPTLAINGRRTPG
jgi:hypothetical protein